jgi:hypothetical protein
MMAVYCALGTYETDPVQPFWDSVQGADKLDVWEVNEDLTTRRRLRSKKLKNNPKAFLRVAPRRDSCLSVCATRRRTSSGEDCSTCGIETQSTVRLTRCP